MSSNIVKLKHHEQQSLCHTRPPYRQGKKLTAVKVYTVNDESQHLIISGVPKLQLMEDIRKIVMPYGIIKQIALIADYPNEEFTETFHIHYEKIQSARIAKRFVDGKNFYGGLLHVFYAPELETVVETRKKLIQRRKDIAVRIKRQRDDARNMTINTFEPREQYHRKKRCPTLPLTKERLAQQYPQESMSTIYDGIPREIDPRPVSEPSLPSMSFFNPGPSLQLDSTIDAQPATTNDNGKPLMQGVKRKNYKGRDIDNTPKVHVVRPQLIDTKKLGTFNSTVDKTVHVVKRVENGITIKLLPRDEKSKRIVIKDQSITKLLGPSENLQTSIESVKSSIREAMKKN